MREFLVAELAKSILGPAELRETISVDTPLIKYLTGILAPKGAGYTVEASELEEQTRRYEDDFDDPLPTVRGDINPPLDPGNIVNTMGISFTVESDDTHPSFNACITWARYEENNNVWTRNPKYAIVPKLMDASEWMLDENGIFTTVDADAEIKLSVIRRDIGTRTKTNKHFFSVIVENYLKKSSDKDNDPAKFIFQPQIRIVCNEGTKVVKSFDPKFALAESDESDTYEILYRERGIFARGKLVSATWKDVDPQIGKDKQNPKFSNSADEPPFEWIDGQLLGDPKERKAFEEPDVRTEYLPLYSIASPKYDWDVISESDAGKKYTSNTPEITAGTFAESWDAKTLRMQLEPITDAYQEWIKEVDANLQQFRPEKDRIVDRILVDANETLERMRGGIDILCNNDDVRLAFCFANRAIEMQHRWKSNKPFEYRPFQLGFILLTIESIVNPNSSFRETCDLLWVPTGAGKTEAYLMLTALLVSYRRLRELNNSRPGAGTAVITRYTLRLLAIQQFRRTLSLFCACEKLRVEEQNDSSFGWRPKQCKKIRDVLWGSTSFNVGLWVGRDLSPNKLVSSRSNPNQRRQARIDPGAVEIINSNNDVTGSDPCQVSRCPACQTNGTPTILSISPEGLEKRRASTIFLTIRADATSAASIENVLLVCLGSSYTVNVTSRQNVNQDYYTLAMEITPNYQNLKGQKLNWDISNAINGLNLTDSSGTSLTADDILASKPSRPGYFLRKRINRNGQSESYDFDIICPNPECPLGNIEWFAGTPMGSVHNSTCPPQRIDNVNGKNLPDGNVLVEIQDPFQINNNISERIPIPALTVDEQIYGRTPTILVSTVDKFARPAFESEAGAVFGNVDRYHAVEGYFRSDAGSGGPRTLDGQDNWLQVEPHLPPELVIQDELHLIEGPLGSMVGIYETVNDFLFAEGQEGKIKYIASTATVRRAEEQVKSVFARDLSMFPPHGDKINNRFFLKEKELHALDSKDSGRLYMGICAPGKGGLTPHRKMWGSLLQSVYSKRNDPSLTPDEIDKFWTLTGYFNAVRELGGVQALYSQDIPDEIKNLERNRANRRPLPRDGLIEISSRKHPTEIPAFLDTLNTEYPNPAASDALLTTSMFGTGVDISRINAMIVAGQPKTISSYIQATGRVGRTSGALVAVFLRAARPRDLSHYEMFVGNHRQMQRFVEAPTVYPFAEKNMNHCFGPMSVLMLRNMRNKTKNWGLEVNSIMNGNDRNLQEVTTIPSVFEARAQSQPPIQRPSSATSRRRRQSADHVANSNLDHWRITTTDEHGNARPIASTTPRPLGTHGFKFKEYFKSNELTWNNVVLGDYGHQQARDRENPQTPAIRIVYENAPQSLREIEPDFKIQTGDINPPAPTPVMPLRRSSFIYTYGPGSIVQSIDGPRVLVEARAGLFDANRGILPENFRINDPRIDSVLPSLLSSYPRTQQEFQNSCQGIAIYKIPTNAELEYDENIPVHLTREFPDERLCTNYTEHHNALGVNDMGILFQGTARNGGKCPVCATNPNAPEARAIRFVTACKGGHMDEIQWDWWIHRNHPNGRCPGGQTTPLSGQDNLRTFLWDSGRGATTGGITITCPRCDTTIDFSTIRDTGRNCSGRNPENEPLNSVSGSSRQSGCQFQSRVTLMQATNLRTTEILTLLSLDENSTQLENIFFTPQAKSAADVFEASVGSPINDTNLDNFFNVLDTTDAVPEGSRDHLRRCDRAEVIQAIANRNPNYPSTYEGLLQFEFEQLINGSINGVPATNPSATTSGPRKINKFVMNTNNRESFNGNGSWRRSLLVSAVDQLTTLSIQMSWERDIRDDVPTTDPVKVSTRSIIPTANGTNLMWFPGVEFQGEGIFVRFENNNGWIDSQIPPEAKSRNKWNIDGYGKRNDNGDNGEPIYKSTVFRGKVNSDRDELDPHFVWWHTFAHALVRAISDDAGYSSTAIRERVYFERDDANGKIRGGILLYASQPGTEGTMGGLIGLVRRFDQFVEKAIENIESCSADPLCHLNGFTTGGYIGSACHGCMMNSETSCELRNMFLDRKVFLEDPL